MARTVADANRKAGGKAPRKVGASGSSTRKAKTRSSAKKRYGKVNQAKKVSTPNWQVPITKLLPTKDPVCLQKEMDISDQPCSSKSCENGDFPRSATKDPEGAGGSGIVKCEENVNQLRSPENESEEVQDSVTMKCDENVTQLGSANNESENGEHAVLVKCDENIHQHGSAAEEPERAGCSDTVKFDENVNQHGSHKENQKLETSSESTSNSDGNKV